MGKIKNIFNKKGSSTLEYVIIIAAGVAIAGLLLMAVQNLNAEGSLKKKIIAAINGEISPGGGSGEVSAPKQNEIENKDQPGDKLANNDKEKDHEDKTWADKMEEVPGLGWVVKKTRDPVNNTVGKFYGDHIKGTLGGDIIDGVVGFFDPSAGIYEETTGKEWDTGEKLGWYDRYAEPIGAYFIEKKIGKGGKLLKKLDGKLFGGWTTKKFDKYIGKPLGEKRDDFVDWACDRNSSSGITPIGVQVAFASGGDDKGFGCDLAEQVLGGGDKKDPGDKKDHDSSKGNGNSSKYTNDQTKKHVHEGETTYASQSPYDGKWSGEGLHNWKKMKERVKEDGYEFDEILLDENTGVRMVTVRKVGHDPQKMKRYERAKEVLEELKDPNLSDKRRKKLEKQVPPDVKGKDPEDIDPKALSRVESTVPDKTVYPEKYSNTEINELGDKALEGYMKKNNGPLPYNLNPNGKVKPVKFKSKVKGPDGKTFEVEGYVVPKPDGSIDYIDTHYPKFDESGSVKKEK
ncbi:hypothetical protein [Marininema halotolerans]|uniref:Pre-toxin TG n=1 Tax=Marininema halotolerans TaxID=1155944 RepID=A0A1I6P5A1_9BACL|nr:hypothetical protein [Marininema halotolerans]SFS35250.1 hypothetical protein SAMN05444972_101362 [Marininema halotolerans]